MAKKAEYVSQAKTSKIQATSRISLKIKDTFYTVEYSEERIIPDIEGVDLERERELLWDRVNAEVDAQSLDIENSYK